MSALQHSGAWRAIAYWLSIDQLVALLLSGDRWMIAVLSNSPYLQGNSKYYPIASLLAGLERWTIPEPYSARSDSYGVISFPPHLKSLVVSLISRPTPYVHTVGLPNSLTNLNINNDLEYHLMVGRWSAWTTAIQTLTELRSMSIAHESQDIVTGQFIMLGGLYPNLTSLTIGTLDNTSRVIFHDLLPLSLTELSISTIAGTFALVNVVPAIRDVVPTLTNLSSLTLSGDVFTNIGHRTIRYLPNQLRELVIVDSETHTADSHYYIPTEVLNVLPRTITVLDVWIILPDDGTLANLEQLPLRVLKLLAKSEFGTYGRQQGNFIGNFPTLKQLKLTNFLTVAVPSSVTLLKVVGSTERSTDLLGNTNLQELTIQKVDQLVAHSRTMDTFHKLTSCTITRNYDSVISHHTFLSWLDPLILQSLKMSAPFTKIALDIMKWLSTNAKVLTKLVLSGKSESRSDQQSDRLFDLPPSLTSVNLNFRRSNRMKLSVIPTNVVYLKLNGIMVDTAQISGLTQLKELAIDSEAIIGVVDFEKTTREHVTRQMILFVLGLPPQLSKVVITRVQEEERSITVFAIRAATPVARYDLYQWLNTSCSQRDVRSTVAELIATLIPSYLSLPLN